MLGQKQPITVQCFSTMLAETLYVWSKTADHCTVFQYHVSWNIICLDQNSPSLYNVSDFLSTLMKVYPIPYAIFETARLCFIKFLCDSSLSSKVTSQYFFSSNLIYCGQKKPIEVTFGWTLTKFVMSYLKPKVSFSWNFASLFSVMRDTSSVSF